MTANIEIEEQERPEIAALKQRQKKTWESGDFGQIARYLMPVAREFMSRLDLRPGLRVLDVACGSGNLATIAAEAGCDTSGVDIAANLIAQARERARADGLSIDYAEGDAEGLPYPDASFDVVVSMFGVMFAPRPERVVKELLRVTRPGGLIALANWTPEGFIGRMFEIFKKHVPQPPIPGVPSPMEWGREGIVRERFGAGAAQLRLERRMARMRFPFDPAATVEFFRVYYGPTQQAFMRLDPAAQAALRHDLVDLQTRNNAATAPNETDTPAEYLEVHVRRA